MFLFRRLEEKTSGVKAKQCFLKILHFSFSQNKKKRKGRSNQSESEGERTVEA